MTHVILIASLEDRRATGFLRAASARGVEVSAIDHQVLLAQPERLLALLDRPAWVRLDAMGPECTPRLLALGGVHDREPAHGELVAPAARHRGFLAHLERLAKVVATRSWCWLTPPALVAELFDKDRTAERLAAHEIRTTEVLHVSEHTPEGLFAAMAERGASRVFVKLRFGSSASGLAVVSQRNGRRTVWTTLERSGGRWFNSLRVRRLDSASAQDAALAFVLGEGARVELADQKLRLRGRHCDVRFVIVEGRCRLALPRTSTHPITNLHLGGTRGDAVALRPLVGPERWAEAVDMAERAAHGAFMVGVDLLFRASDLAPRVIEVNAFGDLLPGLRSEGRDAYDWQVEALLARKPLGATPGELSRRAFDADLELATVGVGACKT